MNNDLISREALKKAIINQYDLNDPPTLYWWNNIKKIIDNAPTRFDLEGVERAYNNGYSHAKKEFKRPKGEWKDHSEEGYVECPFCNCLTNCDDNIDELHYCWNCGAEMKGGAE